MRIKVLGTPEAIAVMAGVGIRQSTKDLIGKTFEAKETPTTNYKVIAPDGTHREIEGKRIWFIPKSACEIIEN